MGGKVGTIQGANAALVRPIKQSAPATPSRATGVDSVSSWSKPTCPTVFPGG